ncbi:hypothetical protein ACP275_14G179800 [Erythranthe tilingii]
MYSRKAITLHLIVVIFFLFICTCYFASTVEAARAVSNTRLSPANGDIVYIGERNQMDRIVISTPIYPDFLNPAPKRYSTPRAPPKVSCRRICLKKFGRFPVPYCCG